MTEFDWRRLKESKFRRTISQNNNQNPIGGVTMVNSTIKGVASRNSVWAPQIDDVASNGAKIRDPSDGWEEKDRW